MGGINLSAWVYPEGGGDKASGPPSGKSPMAIGFFGNTDTNPPQEAGSNSYFREVRMALCEIR